MDAPTTARFTALVPVKPPVRAKSRLSALGDDARQALVRAFAADTVTATLECPLVGAVLVVTDDHVLAAAQASLGAEVLPDGVAEDLNGSLVQAAQEAHRRRPHLGVVALCGDLPALRAGELTEALTVACAHDTAFVSDAAGDGTTMLAATRVERFEPRFGRGSRAAHLAAGAHEIVEVDVPTLRRDVDTPGDLHDALALGARGRTAMVTTGLRL